MTWWMPSSRAKNGAVSGVWSPQHIPKPVMRVLPSCIKSAMFVSIR